MKRAKSITLIGESTDLRDILPRLREFGEIDRVVAIVSDGPVPGFEGIYAGTTSSSEAERAIRESDVAVLFEGEHAEQHLRMRVFELRGARGFYLHARADDMVLSPRRTARLADRDLIEIAARPSRGLGAVAKRAIDLVVGGLLLVFSLPLVLISALVVLLDSGRPIILRQRRMGLNRKDFDVFKLRTLYVGSENGFELVKSNDTRVTRCGGWLRRHRLDELPQLWNVIRGDMSLIGPRPERPELLESIRKIEPAFHLRTLVKPGITGLAQVLGEYDTGPREKLVYDMQYMTTWSLWLDLRILARTVAVVLAGRGT